MRIELLLLRGADARGKHLHALPSLRGEAEQRALQVARLAHQARFLQARERQKELELALQPGLHHKPEQLFFRAAAQPVKRAQEHELVFLFCGMHIKHRRTSPIHAVRLPARRPRPDSPPAP